MSRNLATAQFHKSKTLYEKYKLGDEIGKGAYGRVYKGLDLKNGDFVAIKQVSLENIPQEDLNIIMQEIDLLKNLNHQNLNHKNHKNIVKYLGSLKTKTHLHIILEYVENGSLANIIKPNNFGPFPESLVPLYISQVLEGLVYLHEQGVIHRDIKGANILTTKEGLVKLADFGVATKLNEADLNAHSVVGTPYWMAPEVIEMSGVCAASDIWSVGCTVLELLTCAPPYYDLQPMPALFRIVQDPHPPIPEGLSADLTDFLRQCFKKDAMQRPDARSLLQHPWIQSSRRVPQSSLRQIGGSIRSIDGDVSITDKNLAGNGPDAEGLSEGGAKCEDANIELENSKMDYLASSSLERNSFDESQGGKNSIAQDAFSGSVDNIKDDVFSARDPTLVLLQNPVMGSFSDKEVTAANPETCKESSYAVTDELARISSVNEESVLDVEQDNEGSSIHDESSLFSFGTGMLKVNSQKAVKLSSITGAQELSQFSDAPGDALLEDLFQPLDRVPGDQVVRASSSTSAHGNVLYEGGRSDLAKELKARMAQKHIENQIEHRKGGKLLEYVRGVIDIDDPVFDENLPAENIFLIQSVEFSKLIGLLKPEQPDDVIVSACQKLLSFFVQRPEQKHVFISQHGFLPLMDLLEVPRNRVICSVLQIINQIVIDNVAFQENACLVGLIPVVMNFAVPDRPREVRMQAALFFQNLCYSSTLTLQMFIACRGIPVLVGFLEADYAKYREMVHLAIDGIWQVFKLQHTTPRNDFCRIAAKNGILLRLVNTLHSLNEAARLASVQGSKAARPRSGPLDNLVVALEPLRRSTSGPDSTTIDTKQSSGDAALEEHEHMVLEVDLIKQQSSTNSASKTSTEKPSRHVEVASNGNLTRNLSASQREYIRPLLSMLDKETPSRNVSGQLEYGSHLPTLEKHEGILPLLHASTERKTNGELDVLMAEFAEFSKQGREKEHAGINGKLSKRSNKKVLPQSVGSTTSNEGASTSGIASQTTSGVLSGSGVLNARPGSSTSSGLLSQMVSSLNADVAREYLEKVADLLFEFAQADSSVKSYMCSQSLLTRLFQMFNKIEPPILLKILKCVNHLSGDPNCLEYLQRADAIKHLIPNLELHDGPFVSQIHIEVLNTLFNLCKINKRRQEQAAENGIIPHLMNFIMSDSSLKHSALPLLCDMAHASRNSREQVRIHGGLDVYLNLLEDEAWAVTALDSLAVCLAHDNDHKKVEQALLRKEAIQKLVKFFRNCPEQYFINILEPFLKIITKSARINTAMATNGLATLLISRLDHHDAIARLNLLKLIKAVYEHHPRPKQLIVENDLPQKLQNLIEERRNGQRSGGQVLVKQMATALVKALHINTIL
ncbi:MAP3K epsilon protein kinase 1-like [Phalaenopsis equestris]|uniref:MAP3K epsilon protein kinase 1-like n=1 Tax=Phalaenopsis equestris TaxID=78828 RepID=UPI0009E5CC70|nr:MAP3K epsilon protein kinase 1-like [Phalaenopsis equestris]